MSAVFDRIRRPDWASTTTIAINGTAPHDPERWARAIFDVRSSPKAVKGLFALREVVARLLNIPPGDPSMLAVRGVERGEAVIDADDRHLRFVAAVRVESGLLHVTTAVLLRGW